MFLCVSKEIWSINARVIRWFPSHVSELDTELYQSISFFLPEHSLCTFVMLLLNFRLAWSTSWWVSLACWPGPRTHQTYVERYFTSSPVFFILTSSTTVFPVTHWSQKFGSRDGTYMARGVSFTTTPPFCPCKTPHQIQHSLLPNLDMNINF